MEHNYNNENFLARWLSDDLSLQELKEFKESDAYKDYQKILKGTDRFQMPEYDKEKWLKVIRQKTTTKVRRLIPSWMYAAAAAIVILISGYYFLNASTTVTSNFGEQLAVVLPDGSEVMLNAKSSIKYNEKKWKENRKVNLKGEAFFKVKKGSSFIVESKQGKVQVLGTQFNVISNENYFEVKCHEGKVSAESISKVAVLTQGKAFRNNQNKIEEYTFTEELPSWLQGESTFMSAPLSQVITALEKQFNIKIDAKNVDVNERFTGSFSHKNLKLALKTVFIPMEINYTFKNENTVILVKG